MRRSWAVSPLVYAILGGHPSDCQCSRGPLATRRRVSQPEPLYPIKSWRDVPPDITGAEIHGLAVKDFSPLHTLKKLRFLRAVCDTPRQYKEVGSLSNLRWLALDHCGATGLTRFGGLTKLRALKLFAFKAASLDGVGALPALEYLQIEHAPKITSVEPLGGCGRLRWLWVSTPPGWDASRKTIKVESLAPLSQVATLEFLHADGSQPSDASLQPLARLTRLKQLQFSHVFTVPMAEYARLAAALPNTGGDCLRASHALNVRVVWPRCKEADLVSLTAPRPRTKAQLAGAATPRSSRRMKRNSIASKRRDSSLHRQGASYPSA